jgi:hypothetical protein
MLLTGAAEASVEMSRIHLDGVGFVARESRVGVIDLGQLDFCRRVPGPSRSVAASADFDVRP